MLTFCFAPPTLFAIGAVESLSHFKEEPLMAAKTSKPATKSEILGTISEKTGLKKKQVSDVFDQLAGMISKGLGKQGPGVFALAGLVKFKVVNKPASPGGMRPNPFKPGEMMEVKPKPARRVVKALPLKALKEMAS